MESETKRNDGRTEHKNTPNSLAGLTAFQRDILWVLKRKGGAEYGLGIKAVLEEYRGEDINHGRLYPNLDTLKDMGLIEKRPLDKRTNEYSLSSLAERLLAGRQAWQSGGDE